jgi:hypothetical protein
MNYATTNTRKFFILVSSVLVGVLLAVGLVSASTTISTDIMTGGNLSVSGTSTLATTTATNLTVTGTCIGCGGGGGSGTVNAGTQGQVAFYNANGTAVSATSSLSISPSGDVSFPGNVTVGSTMSVGSTFSPASFSMPFLMAGTPDSQMADGGGDIGVGSEFQYTGPSANMYAGVQGYFFYTGPARRSFLGFADEGINSWHWRS